MTGNYSKYDDMAVSELERIRDISIARRDAIMDSCVKRGVSFDEYEKEAMDEVEKIYFIDKFIRKKKEPAIEYGKKWKGRKYTFNDFIKDSNNGTLADTDGIGYYATADGKSDIKIMPSDVKENIYRNDFSHVQWFEKKEEPGN